MAKIVDTKQLLEVTAREKRIIFTHGTFDLFHVGHLEMLKRSKALGGKLIIGLDSDESVEAYKRRPVVSQYYRARILAHLDFVDYVLPLDIVRETKDFDYYYLKLYSQLRPDFLTYGDNFPFISEVDTKCRLVGIRNKQIKHSFGDVTTTQYIKILEDKYKKFVGNTNS